MTETTPISVVPILTTQQILPLPLIHELSPTFNTSASVNSLIPPSLEFSCSVMIPSEIDVNDVQVYQYSSSILPRIEFYFVYSYGGQYSGNFRQLDFQITAQDKNALLIPILMTHIETVVSLVKNDDPKTSRGTVTTVIHTS